MHVQPPRSAGQSMPQPHEGGSKRDVPEPPQGACRHDGGTRSFDAYSDRERCVACGLVLPLAPLPDVDLDEGSDLAWAVALYRRPPSFPGVLALVALSRSVRCGDASWALHVFADELERLRRLGHTPRSYFATA